MKQGVMGNPYFFTCRPVNLFTMIQRSRDKYRRARDYGLSLLVYLSTCLPGLTGPEVFKGEQGIMGIPCLSTCRPVNLFTRIGRSRGKCRSSRHYEYSVLVHLSTCQPVNQPSGLTSLALDMNTGGSHIFVNRSADGQVRIPMMPSCQAVYLYTMVDRLADTYG